jgi:purine-nucleoside phosphorylase
MTVTYQDITSAAEQLRGLLPEGFTPQFGIIGGSGLSALGQAIQEPRTEVSYGDIKGFPVSTGMDHVRRTRSDFDHWCDIE